jgi:serine/threonine-protein kinase
VSSDRALRLVARRLTRAVTAEATAVGTVNRGRTAAAGLARPHRTPQIDEEHAMTNDPDQGAFERTTVPLGSTVTLVVSAGQPPAGSLRATVPDVVGRQGIDAQEAFQREGLTPQSVTAPNDAHPRGAVTAQWPPPGDPGAVTGPAALRISEGPAAERLAVVGVPTVIGRSEATAIAAMERIGLQAVAVRAYSPTAAAGIVFAQLPEEHTAVLPRKQGGAMKWILAVLLVLVAAAAIVFFLNRSDTPAATVATPSLVGLTQAAAEQRLADAKLAVGRVTEKEDADADPGKVIAQDPSRGTEVDEGTRVDLVIAIGSALIEVPDVTGRTEARARQALTDAKLAVAVTRAADETTPKGEVVSQSPTKGQRVPAGTQVGIVVSTGPKVTTIAVPNVVGLTTANATARLGDAGLGVQPFEALSADVPAGTVISQAPGRGTSVPTGTPIAIIVSTGPPTAPVTTVKVPDVVGESLADAQKALAAAGLKTASEKLDGSGKPADEVLFQTPAAGATVIKGSDVIVIVSSGN